jgi:hypothetical protein
MADNNNTQGPADGGMRSGRARRYFLFVHHNVKEDEIIEYGRGPAGLKGAFYGHFGDDLRYLVGILNRRPDSDGQQWEGRAFVFVDVGWTHLLRTEDIAAARTLAQGLQRIRNEIMEHLCLDECRLDTCSERRARRVAPWPGPIQIITAAELIELLAIIDELLPPTTTESQARVSTPSPESGEAPPIPNREDTWGRPQRGKLSQYLLGGVAQLRYDASKAIEGLIRIANVGRNVPIFRFDDDVIFYGQRVYDTCYCLDKDEKGNCRKDEQGNPMRVLQDWAALNENGVFLLKEMEPILDRAKDDDPSRADWPGNPLQRLEKWRDTQAEETSKNIVALCERYERACANPKLHYFVFSGHYLKPKDERVSPDLDEVLNGYATRVAQLAQLPTYSSDAGDPTHNKKPTTIEATLAARFLNELPEIGANPRRQVVSGGGLCLSDGAILDLPPYSNMRLNVMWIDDHLKYALHDELQHFDIHILEVGPAREEDARFPQLRHANPPTYKDVHWHLHQYMQRLLLGCVVDSWLRDDEKGINMKEKILPDVQPPYLPEDIEEARRQRETVRSNRYAKAFLDAVPGRPSAKKMWDLRRQLWETAVQRLQKVCKQWRNNDYRNTFLGLFVWGKDYRGGDNNGELPEEFKLYIPKYYQPKGLLDAVTNIRANPYDDDVDDVAADRKLREESVYLDKLKPDGLPLADSLQVLIDDFIGYFETVSFWSTYVRAVRFLVSRSGQNPELRWLFPPDESYEPRNTTEPILHVLEQLTDLHLSQEDFKVLTEIGRWEGGDPPEDWRQCGRYEIESGPQTSWNTNEARPKVLVNSEWIRDFARRNDWQADIFWLVVRCYHLARALLVRGYGHGMTAPLEPESVEADEFALAYTYFFLESEGRQTAVDLLKRLADDPRPALVREANNNAVGGKDRLETINNLLYALRPVPMS